MFEIIIIGSGPSGLSAAIEAKRAGLSHLVIEKGGIVNAIQNFPTEMTFFSTPELLEIGDVPFTSANMRPTRAEGLEYYSRVAAFHQLNCRYFEAMTSIVKKGNEFVVTTTKGEYRGKNVVLATGYYDHPILLGLPGEDRPNVSHYYHEPYPYFRQNVLVIGAKNSAAIAALELFRHGANVTLVHRGEKLSEKIKYWILPDIENRIKEGSVTAHFNTTVTEIRDGEVLLNGPDGPFSIPNDFVFALTGYHPDYDLLRSLGLRMDESSMAPVIDQETFETSVSGLFVAGSVVAGKNNNSIFIENGRLHGKAIVNTVLKRH